MACIVQMEQNKDKEEEKILIDLQAFIEDFQAIFEMPKELPLSRLCDHRIPLIDPSKSVCARPYRYPYHQKNEIERQIREILETGIVRESSSPFTSPVVLVKMADRS